MKMIKKVLAVVLACITVCVCFVGCSAKNSSKNSASSDYENIKAKGELVVGITDFAPMDYKDENGNWTGFDAELANKLGEKLGVNVKFVEIDWDNKFIELSTGSIDCLWNGLTITDEVINNSSVTEAYAKNQQIIISNPAPLAIEICKKEKKITKPPTKKNAFTLNELMNLLLTARKMDYTFYLFLLLSA